MILTTANKRTVRKYFILKNIKITLFSFNALYFFLQSDEGFSIYLNDLNDVRTEITQAYVTELHKNSLQANVFNSQFLLKLWQFCGIQIFFLTCLL